jgi:L-threonylcarbamoyladenylate synthase
MIRTATADAVRTAADLIVGGELVAFPTETVYGLGADALNAAAVARIFAVKARPAFDPLIVHVASMEMLADLVAELPAAARILIERCWPGPLTVVVRKRPVVPDIVTAGLPTVAVRVPDHDVARALIGAAGRPIAAPSANPFGYVSPTTAAHVAAQLGSAVPLILDGGPCRVGVESTIVSFSDAQPVLLRPGGVALETIEHLIGPVRIGADTAKPLAPGALPRHYAPRIPFEVIASPGEVPVEARSGAALLLAKPVDDIAGFAHVEVLSETGDVAEAAVNLFAAMRRLDAGGYSRIYAVAVSEVGLGRAIMDRLRRAQHSAA